MKLTKSKPLLTALIVGFLLIGPVGCGGSEVPAPAPTPAESADQAASGEEPPPNLEGNTEQVSTIDTDALQVELNSSDISSEMEAIASAHSTYLGSIQDNLIAPLSAITARGAETNTRNRSFVERTNLNIGQADADTEAFATAVQNAVDAVAKIKQSESESPQLALLEGNLTALQQNIGEINRVVLQPLTSQPSAAPVDVFIDSGESDLSEEQRKAAIGSLQNQLPNDFVGKVISTNYVGIYGTDTFNAVQGFVNTQNQQIADAVSSLPVITGPLGEDDPSVSWVAWMALLFAILNGLAFGYTFWLLQRTRKQQEKLAKALYRTSNSPQGQAIAINDTWLETTIQKLEQQVMENKNSQTMLANNLQNIQAALRTNDVSSHTASQSTGSLSVHAREAAYAQAQQPRATRTDSGHRPQPSRQDVSSFGRIATVKMTKKSQEEIWVGKNVAAVFSESSQGDYYIVSSDKQRFYIILKDRALINANNLKTLKILYDFADQPKLSTLKRRYDTPAEVKPLGGNEWELLSPGKLTFY